MKTRTIFFLLLISSLTTLGQTKQEIKNLDQLARIWGFLKYYHPAVADGKKDWDQELCSKLKEVQYLDDKKFRSAIDQWIRSLPAARLSAHATQPAGDSIVTVFKIDEIGAYNISDQLKNSFRKLYTHHIPDSSVFITNKYKQYTLDFILFTEKDYEETNFPAKELRLLGLFRYWNAMNYFYPHKHIIPGGWENVLQKAIPEFLNAKNASEYQFAMQKLRTKLKDTHAFYNEAGYDANQQYRTTFNLKQINNRYYIDYLFDNEITRTGDYRLGDEIISINGCTVKAIAKELARVTAASNNVALQRIIATDLFRADTAKTLTVVFNRNGLLLTKQVKRYTFNELVKGITKFPPLWKQVDATTWYVDAGRINRADTLKRLFTVLENAKTVIFDLRVYPNYNVINTMVNKLIKQRIDAGYDINGDIRFPGIYIRKKSIFMPDSNEKQAFTGKLILLVDERTQSLGETIAALLSLRPNTIVVGAQTAGTTGNISNISVPGKITLSYTGAGFEGAGNSFIQQKGVKLDVKVKVTPQGLRDGRDEVLEKAILLAN